MVESDVGIMLGIITAFFVLGFGLPFIHDAFGETASTLDTGGINFQAGQGFSTDSTSVLEIIVSVTTIFFFTFGAVPLWLDAIILLPIRIIFFVLLYRQIRGVGG